MVALARLASAMNPQARGAAPRTLLSSVGAHSRAFLTRAQAPAHAASAVRVQAGAGAAAGRTGVAWTTLRDGVHRRSMATAAGRARVLWPTAAAVSPAVADPARLLPPVRSPFPCTIREGGAAIPPAR